MSFTTYNNQSAKHAPSIRDLITLKYKIRSVVEVDESCLLYFVLLAQHMIGLTLILDKMAYLLYLSRCTSTIFFTQTWTYSNLLAGYIL